MPDTGSRLADLVKNHEALLLTDWVAGQKAALADRSDLIKEAELKVQGKEFLSLLRGAVRAFRKYAALSPAEILEAVHTALHGTRGIAASLAEMYRQNQELLRTLEEFRTQQEKRQEHLPEIEMLNMRLKRSVRATQPPREEQSADHLGAGRTPGRSGRDTCPRGCRHDLHGTISYENRSSGGGVNFPIDSLPPA